MTESRPIYTIIFNQDIDTEGLEYLALHLNSVPPDFDIHMYIRSEGGFVNLIPVFQELINNYNIQLYWSGDNVSSAAVLLFMNFPNVKILEESVAIIHLPYIDNQRLSSDGKKVYLSSNNKQSIKETRDSTKQWLKMFRSFGLNKKQMKRLKEGKDVVLGYKKLTKILQKHIEE